MFIRNIELFNIHFDSIIFSSERLSGPFSSSVERLWLLNMITCQRAFPQQLNQNQIQRL